MFIEEDEDRYLSSTDYNSHYILEGPPSITAQNGHEGNNFSNYPNLNDLNTNLNAKGGGDICLFCMLMHVVWSRTLMK